MRDAEVSSSGFRYGVVLPFICPAKNLSLQASVRLRRPQ